MNIAVLTEEYRANGFVVARGLFGADLLREVTAEVERVVQDAAATAEHGRMFFDDEAAVIAAAEVHRTRVDPEGFGPLEEALSPERFDGLSKLAGQTFEHRWQLVESLAAASDAWRAKPDDDSDPVHSKRLKLENLLNHWGMAKKRG